MVSGRTRIFSAAFDLLNPFSRATIKGIKQQSRLTLRYTEASQKAVIQMISQQTCIRTHSLTKSALFMNDFKNFFLSFDTNVNTQKLI